MESPADKIERAINSPEILSSEKRDLIVRELQEFTKKLEIIERKYKASSLESWINPTGVDGRSWNEEIDYALAHRNEGYVPRVRYPALERGFLDPNNPEETKLDVPGGLSKLDEISKTAAETYPETAEIVSRMVDRRRKEFLFLEAVRTGDHDGQIKYMPYEFPDPALVAFAENSYKTTPESETKSDTENKLQGNVLTPDEVQEYFEYALNLIHATGWVTKPLDGQTSISVVPESKEVRLPINLRLSALKLLKLVGHEIGAHVGTAVNAERNGFGSCAIGEESQVLQEGLARVTEHDVEEMLTGRKEYSGPSYVIAINTAIKNGGNFWETYDSIKKDFKATKGTLKRIFRGSTDLSKDGYVFTKDKAYLEGEMVAGEIQKRGLLGYLLSGKYDVNTAIFLLKNKVIPKESVNLVIDVAQKIWANKGDRDFFTNLDYFRENYNPPYWRDFGMTDKEYLQKWREAK